MKNENCRMQNNISERLLDFATTVVSLTQQINKTHIGPIIGNQLLRSSTSSGANYEEACSAESHADFIHKMQIVLKELRESSYWLKLIDRTKIINNKNINMALQESTELTNIIAKSIVTARKNN